jgi:hypothetical protein
MLARSHPDDARRFLEQAQKDAEQRYQAYQAMAHEHAEERKPGA